MSEFIGSRISLISKSDIRYVGTLHEINSESSTVALEQVTSFGTEGRRSSPEDEVPASSEVYEYIVFRGSDVKDLRIEEPPKENKPPPPPPQVPNDPAILGTGSRPPTLVAPSTQQVPQGLRSNQPPHFQQPPPFPYQQYNQYPPQQRFGGPPGGPGPGFQGPPGGFHGYPGMPYGAPPGWYPPPGQGFAQPPGAFSPHHQMPPFGGPPPQSGLPQQQQQLQQQRRPPPKSGVPESMEQTKAASVTDEAPKSVRQALATPAKDEEPVRPTTDVPSQKGPTPPVDSKPDVAAALAPPTVPTALSQTFTQAPTSSKPIPTGPKSGRIVPAVPLASPVAVPKVASKAAPPLQSPLANITHATAAKSGQAAANAALQYQNATQAATAAVAAAMAKLPPVAGVKPKQGTDSEAMDNLTKKVNDMRTDDRIRHGGQPGTGGYAAGHRGGRGGGRGGARRGGREPGKGLEVPMTDFDFESSNAQFNKQDLVKEAIATGSPLGTPTEGEAPSSLNGDSSANGTSEVVIPAATASTYNKSSFFDNLSSEAKDREDAADGTRRASGQEFRSDERRRNMETFGLGSVDGGYRGGYRGRGRGRGGFRGGYGRGSGPRGVSRGGRGDAAFGIAYAATSTGP